jgi:Fe2+ transport protein
MRSGFRNTALRSVLALAALALLGGCAAANKEAASTTSTSATPAASNAAASGSMAGMNMGAGAAASGAGTVKVATAGGVIKPVPTQVLGTATWQGMKITAQAMTDVPFEVYNGTSAQVVKPPPNSSFHLMVMLNDAYTDVPIPYATVWATIREQGKVVFDERQWPMIARYMGPHYGNDVTLPGAGTYQLSLLISPPVSARHMEYADVWTEPHRVEFTFPWKPVS